MHVQRVYSLTTREFEGLFGTDLFSCLVSRKYVIQFPSSSNIMDGFDYDESVRSLVEMHATGPWYAHRNTYYFSNDNDACFFEKDVLEYTIKEEENGHTNPQQRS